VAGRAGDQLVLAERDDQLHQVTADVAQVSSACGSNAPSAITIHTSAGPKRLLWPRRLLHAPGRKNFGQPPPYYASATVTTGEKNPLTDKGPEPKYLDGHRAELRPEDDPRHALADWMAKPDNPFFAKALVNRLWGHFLGRGLFHEVDDQRDTNPPSNPELLDALAKDFVAHGFDVKHVIRTILNSACISYRLSRRRRTRRTARTSPATTPGEMPAEVFLDAVNQTTGVKGGFNGVSSSARAVDFAARELRVLLPRHVRSAQASDGLRMRALHRGDARPGTLAGEFGRDRGQDRCRRRPGWHA